MKPTPWVNYDRLNDEVMVINLESGAYYAFGGAAADTWTLLANGQDPQAIGDQLSRRYDVVASVAAEDARTFASELETEGLLITGDADPSDEVADVGARDARLPYETPSVDKYDDLQDLLLIDPIHEVDETGWPAGRPD